MKNNGNHKVTRDRGGWLITSPAGFGKYITGVTIGDTIHVFGEYPTRGNAEQHAKELREYRHDGVQVWSREQLTVRYSVKAAEVALWPEVAS